MEPMKPSPIEDAANQGNSGLVRLILAARRRAGLRSSAEERRALRIAVDRCDAYTVRALLDYGVDAGVNFSMNYDYKDTPFHVAVYKRHTTIVNDMLAAEKKKKKSCVIS